MKTIIKILIMTLIVGAIGQYTTNMVPDTLRLRRRSSRRELAEMTIAANMRNGKLGMVKGLVV